MNDRQRTDEAVKHLKDSLHIEDRRPFWKRLLAGLRVSVSGKPRSPKVTIKGGTDF